MEKRDLKEEIKKVAEIFLEKTKSNETIIISHHDTDGITSATIMIKSLRKIDRKFSLKIIKSLEEDFIYSLPKDKLILFLDLASGSIHHIINSKLNLEDIFIIDHHEIPENSEIPENLNIINPELERIKGKQKISASGLTYLFCREINSENKKFAKLAILGMVGDYLEKSIDKLNNGILEEGEIQKRRGLLIYPSTRPINRVLEYSSYPYIPGVTGNVKGVLELLREVGINQKNGKYPSITELDDEKMSKIITAIMIRNPKAKSQDIIGDVFLIKMFNKLEDVREISAIINACSRLGKSETAIKFCMEISKAKKDAESIYVKYKQHLISGLKFVEESEKIMGNGFIIINARDKIKDTIIGTIASIISSSALYEEGTIITTMALDESRQKIKVSSRIVGKNGRNVREILSLVVNKIGGEVGGHNCAAGCLINQEKEQEFIDDLKKNLEIELVKI